MSAVVWLEPGLQLAQARDDLEQPHQGEVAQRKQAVDALFSHRLAADPGEHGVRPARGDRVHQAGADGVAAGLAGNQIDQGHAPPWHALAARASVIGRFGTQPDRAGSRKVSVLNPNHYCPMIRPRKVRWGTFMTTPSDGTADPPRAPSAIATVRPNPDRMQIPEYVKRELSEVYLLMDHIAGRTDKTLDKALAATTTANKPVMLEEICAVPWPPSEQNRAEILALVLTAKDRLSHAAFPATGHSVAFTYLSVNAPLRAPRHGWFAKVRQRLAWGRKRPPGATAQHVGNAQDRGGESGGDTGSVDTAASDEPTMVQFALDAFPSLKDKQDLLTRRRQFLATTLLVLLGVTCLVSWDLAVGQRLLADYRWLSLHPQTMQNDQAANTPCATVTAPAKDEPCARYLAFQRVQSTMEDWIGRQVPFRLFIQGSPPEDRSPTVHTRATFSNSPGFWSRP